MTLVLIGKDLVLEGFNHQEKRDIHRFQVHMIIYLNYLFSHCLRVE